MRRLFWLVCLVLVIDTAFYAAITPLLPTYADDLGLSKTAAGVLSASYAAGTLAGALPGGWLAVRFGVKPTLLTGLSLLAVTSVVFGLAENVVVLDVSRFFQGVGGACSWAAEPGLAGGRRAARAARPADRRRDRRGDRRPVLRARDRRRGHRAGHRARVRRRRGLRRRAGRVGAADAGGAGPAPKRGCAGWPPRCADARDLRTGFLLFTLPALFSGVLEVLVPLRLDVLGASGVAVGAAFLVAAAVEATVSPHRRPGLGPPRAAGPDEGRPGRGRGRRPGAGPAGERRAARGAAVRTVAALGTFWAPAMALLTDAADGAGVGHAMAIAIANLAWALGHVIGGGAGSGLADLTADAVPYALLSAPVPARARHRGPRAGRRTGRRRRSRRSAPCAAARAGARKVVGGRDHEDAALLLLQPGEEGAEQRRRDAAVGLAALPARTPSRSRRSTAPRAPATRRSAMRLAQVPLGLADVLVVEAAGVELEQRQLPAARDRLGGERLAAALHAHEQHARAAGRLSAAASGLKPTAARSSQRVRRAEAAELGRVVARREVLEQPVVAERVGLELDHARGRRSEPAVRRSPRGRRPGGPG